ncbi:High-affinity carbon uptake protein Hat/HatR [Bathymodiolus azoricus thioautotrophic gill symbiont]|uniref:High-affinity carbon uptake protein Hat/HatR n=2 Tax=Bathymodiolus azoricus thioautotrophic gill symbiont TaxID=235205 RepID=A0ACA8ZT54_9GAMM|nr:hypothetical protein [Bathymodiolus azoricus thioautotrophic gill symbiont]CAB5507376.1 High-affinity carbon uptake protein Hat/HatR [Bathymodiolus azoricus thioautotrophic gill symbiont]
MQPKQTRITEGFEYFLKQNELGKTDSKNINQLLLMMDENGYIDKQTILEKIFAKAADANANYRNFIKRILDAIGRLIEDSEADSKEKRILNSIEVNTLKANKMRKAQLQLKVGYFPTDIQPLKNWQYDDENFELNTAKDATQSIDKDAIRIFISYSKHNESDTQHFKRLFEAKNPDIGGKKVVIWTMQELIAGSAFDKQIQEKLNRSDFGIGAFSQQFLQSDYILNKEIPHFLEQNALFLFGLDKRIDGKKSSIEDFFSKVSQESDKDNNTHILQQHVCHLNDGSGDFFVDCATPERKNAFVDKVIKDLTVYYNELKDNPQQIQKTNKTNEINPCLDVDDRYLRENHQNCLARPMSISTKTEVLPVTKIEPATNIEVDLITDMLDWIENTPQSIYALLGDYGMGKTFSCRILSAKLTEQKGTIEPFYIDLRDTPTLVTDNNIVRQPYLEEIIQSVLRRQNITADAQTFIQKAQDGSLIFIFDGLDEKLVHYTKDMRQQFLAELMRVFPNTHHRNESKVKIILSCRSHHFEDLKSQNGFFRGLGRDNSAQQDYRAMEILHFNSTQIQSMLTKQLGAKDSALVFQFINDNHYLLGLASHPFLLNKIAHSLPALQKLKHINSTSLYQALIEDTLSRDDEKHVLHRRHKKRLLQDLAYYLWQNKEQVLPIDDLNDWYQHWLRQDADLYAQYKDNSNAKLEQDLRNSTLLVRFSKSDFGFTHSSMQEFFIAQKLTKKWQESSLMTLDGNISPLTRQFILDNIVLLSTKEITQLHQVLIHTLTQKSTTPVARLALDMVSTMHKHQLAMPMFEVVQLSQLKLQEISVFGLNCQRLIINATELFASEWTAVTIGKLHLTLSNLNKSVWRHSQIQTLHSDVELNSDSVLTSGLYQWTLTQCQFLFQHAELSARLDWHIYTAQRKLNAMKSITGLEVLKFMQTGHTHEVSSANFSPDGKQIVSASTDNKLKLWDLVGNCLQTFTGHTREVSSANFSPDGKQIISASIDNSLKLWDLTGNCLQTFTGHTHEVSSANFSPDGKQIISASWDGSLKLWDLAGNCLQTFTGHTNWVQSANFSPDGKQIISASWDGSLKLWDLAGNCLQTFTGHTNWVRSANFSLDGKQIVSASGDNSLKLWDLAGNCLQTFTGHTDVVWSTNFSPDGKQIVSASMDGSLKLWDLAGNCLQTFAGHTDVVWSANFSPDGKQIVSASGDNSLKLWDLAGNCLQTFTGHTYEVRSANFSPNGKKIVSASMDNSLKLWDLAGNCLQTFTGHTNWVQSANFSPNGKKIVSASMDNSLKLWDLAGNCLQTFTGHTREVLSANFSPDGKQIVSASGDNSLKLWDLVGNCLQTFTGHTNWVQSANFSPDGKQIVSASREICIWQLAPQSQPSWQLQHLWGNGYRLSFTDKALTAIQATDTAWQTLNFSNGTQTMSIDNHAGFELDEPRNLEI